MSLCVLVCVCVCLSSKECDQFILGTVVDVIVFSFFGVERRLVVK